MEKKILLIDMDNTLNRLWEKFVEHYNIIYEKSDSVSRSQMLTYDIVGNISSIFPEDKNRIRDDIFNRQSFWSTIELMDSDTVEVFNELNKKYETYICTMPWTKYIDCCREKTSWMKKNFHGFDAGNMIFMRKKHLIRADFIIDDSPEFLTNNMTKTIAMDFPYNRHVPTTFRVESWKEIADILL